VIFLLGSAGLREYINFIVAHNHAYGTLAAPIAALLFFFLLALGVLLGAEFNAAIEQASPSTRRRPRSERRWQQLPGPSDAQSEPPPAGIDS
jgi:membrane protein